jgi:methylglutaconyl-CoA hydratase
MSFLIESELKEGVLQISLNRPEIHNAFNELLIEEITLAFKKARDDKNVRLIVLTGEGKSFCSGADLNWMKSMKQYSMEENIVDSNKLFDMFETINNFNKPVIGKINGHALGGGIGLVSVCDYVISAENAKFGFTEVRLGLIPAVISKFCISKIGESNARAWFLSGEVFSSDKAKSIGLVHEVIPKDSIDVRTNEIIDSYLLAGPEASKEAKKLIREVISLGSEDIKKYTSNAIAERRVSDEGQEGMEALLEKRRAKWVHND